MVPFISCSIKSFFSFLLGFPTTWLIEAGFSAANDVLTKKHNLLQIEEREDLLRLKLNQDLEDQHDKLIDTTSSEVISQDLYFKLHFAQNIWPIGFIFIVILTMLLPICPSSFFQWHETSEEGRRTYRPKCCKYNNKNEVYSLNILSNNNYQA